MSSPLILGIDVGGSHITTGLVDMHAKQLLTETQCRIRVNSKGTVDEIIDTWVEAIQATIAHRQDQSAYQMGIAMPGPFDYEEGISYMQNQDKYDSLYGLNVKELLARKLNLEPRDLRFMNDAACFLQGELFVRGEPFTSAIGLTLGTGLGSSSYQEGEHIAKDCGLYSSPFLNGMAEDYISTRWFVKRYQEIFGNQVNNVKEIVDQLNDNPKVKILFHEFGVNLGSFLAGFIKSHEPSRVIIGGSIAHCWDLFYDTLVKVLDEHSIHVSIEQSKLGEEANLLGGASLWNRN